MSADIELIGFDPELHKGQRFSGWISRKMNRVVFIARMYHVQSVMEDVDFYDTDDDYVGERFGLRAGDVFVARDVYPLMYEAGWVRFYTEYTANGPVVLEGKRDEMRFATDFVRMSGHNKEQIKTKMYEGVGSTPSP